MYGYKGTARRKRCTGCGWLVKDCGCADPMPDPEEVRAGTKRMMTFARWIIKDQDKPKG